jgi:peptidoglycan/LPS O-acetylase OafA/YrhL
VQSRAQPIDRAPVEDTGRPAGRVAVLDSLRGLAAVIVVFHHFLAIFPSLAGDDPNPSRWAWAMQFTPLHLLWDGLLPVLFFFILSGYVLSLPYHEGRALPYSGYLLKRICRIYLPYLAAVLSAFALFALLSRGPIPSLSRWLNSIWNTPISWPVIASHATFLGSFDNGRFDPVLWSLVHEMRISIVFPGLMWLLLRLPWFVSLGASVTLSLFVHERSFATDYWQSGEFLLMFVVGALLARHSARLVAALRRQPVAARALLLVAGVGACVLADGIPFMGALHHWNEYTETIGLVLILLGVLSSRRLSALLEKPAFQFLGRVSYSLYLFHALILLALVHAFYGRLPVVVILGIGLLACPLVAWSVWRLVERPAMKLGARLARRAR